MNDFKVILEAMIDNSSLTNVQKQLAKERLKINADISVEDFAKSKQEIEKQIGKLAKNIKNILGTAITDKQASQWAKQYYDGMVSGAKEAAKAQEKLNAEQRKNTLAEQEKYYKRIIENNKEIYALKEKKLSADKEESKELQRQITNLEKRNKRAYDSISQKGLGDTQWGLEVSNSEKELKNRLAIKEARLQDKANAKEQSLIDKQVAEYNKQEAEYIKLRNKYLAEGKKQEEDFYNSKALESEKAEQQAIANKEKAYQDAYKELKKLYDLRIEYAKIDDPDNNQKYLYENAISKQEDKWRKAYANTSEPENWDVQKRLELQRQEVAMQEKLEHAYGRVAEAKKQSKKVDEIQLLKNEGKFTSQISDVTADYNKLSVVTDELKADFKELNRLGEVLNTSADADTLTQSYEQFNTTLQKVKNNISVMDDQGLMFADQKKVDSLAESVLKFRDNNTKMSKDLRRGFTGIYDKLISDTRLTEKEVKELSQQFTNLKLKVRDAGQLGQSFGDKMKNAIQKFGEWGFATGIVTKATNEISKSVNELKELDNILTEISKTSDLTEQQLKKLGDTAFDSASKYGRKANDYLTGVQEMYRAGFDNSEEMAELSVLAQSAGDMDSTLSNDYIMATNAAYKYKGSVEELNDVLDRQNYITNNAAISMKDIADATTETASVAAQYGVQIDELSALIATATANTRESGSEVGTALKAILINLQDTTSKPVTETFDALGISMTKVVNGAETLKTPIELIYELADAYNSLPEGDIMRANILNEIGQKRHANTLASILGDMDSLNHMLELYNSNLADDSAYNEAMKSANNWQGTINKLSNSWSDLVQNFADSDTIIGAINLVNGLVQALDKLGAVGTIGLGLGAGLGIKNVGKRRSTMFRNCFEYADRDKCSLYKIGFLSPIVKYTLVNEATISVEII